jgi:hypothetical protein
MLVFFRVSEECSIPVTYMAALRIFHTSGNGSLGPPLPRPHLGAVPDSVPDQSPLEEGPPGVHQEPQAIAVDIA